MLLGPNTHMASREFVTSGGVAVTYATTHDKIEDPVDTSNFIDNQVLGSETETWIEVHDPATRILSLEFPKPLLSSSELQSPVRRKRDRKSVV